MYKILVVGGGSIGERHVRCILATKRAEVSLCELNQGLLKDVAGRYPLAQALADFGSVDLSSFDGVVICTPANMHIKMCRQVVAAGTNIFCEKPLTVKDEGVQELMEELERAPVVAGVGFTWRYMPFADELYRQFKQGAIGQLKYINIRVGQHFPYYRPAYKSTYFTKPQAGGGAILDAMSHQVSLAQMFAGNVASVCGMYNNSGQLDVEVEDTVDAMLAFAEGGTANIHVNLWQYPSETTIVLVGTKGSLRYCGDKGSVGLCSEINGPWKQTDIQVERDDNYIAEANNFLNAIEGKEKVRCSMEEAYHTQKVCWAIRESADQGRRIDIQVTAGGG